MVQPKGLLANLRLIQEIGTAVCRYMCLAAASRAKARSLLQSSKKGEKQQPYAEIPETLPTMSTGPAPGRACLFTTRTRDHPRFLAHPLR